MAKCSRIMENNICPMSFTSEILGDKILPQINFNNNYAEDFLFLLIT